MDTPLQLEIAKKHGCATYGEYIAKQARETQARAEQGILRDTPIDELRHIVANFDSMNEAFNQSFTLGQLITLHRAWMASGWDIYPDHWDDRQVDLALTGIVPEWNDDESPRHYSTADKRAGKWYAKRIQVVK